MSNVDFPQDSKSGWNQPTSLRVVWIDKSEETFIGEVRWYSAEMWTVRSNGKLTYIPTSQVKYLEHIR